MEEMTDKILRKLSSFKIVNRLTRKYLDSLYFSIYLFFLLGLTKEEQEKMEEQRNFVKSCGMLHE